jgi:hypothetical protein
MHYRAYVNTCPSLFSCDPIEIHAGDPLTVYAGRVAAHGATCNLQVFRAAILCIYKNDFA